jgi:hypothetical protein
MPYPAQPHGLTGQAGVVSFNVAGTPAMNGKLRRWERTLRVARMADDRGAGERYSSGVPVELTWEVNVEGIIPATSTRHVLIANEATFGGVGDIALKDVYDDSTPSWVSRGTCDELRVSSPHADVMDFTAHFVCTEALPPTLDTAPNTA